MLHVECIISAFRDVHTVVDFLGGCYAGMDRLDLGRDGEVCDVIRYYK